MCAARLQGSSKSGKALPDMATNTPWSHHAPGPLSWHNQAPQQGKCIPRSHFRVRTVHECCSLNSETTPVGLEPEVFLFGLKGGGEAP